MNINKCGGKDLNMNNLLTEIDLEAICNILQIFAKVLYTSCQKNAMHFDGHAFRF